MSAATPFALSTVTPPRTPFALSTVRRNKTQFALSIVDPAVVAIDRARRDAGLSHAALCAAARVHASTWFYLRRGEQTARPGTLQRLKAALGGRHAVARHSLLAIGALHHAVTALLAHAAGLDAAAVLKQDPAANAPLNTDWRAAAQIRRQASYVLTVELEIPNALLARATGGTRQNVNQARAAVEDAREADGAIAQRLDAVAELVRGRVA